MKHALWIFILILACGKNESGKEARSIDPASLKYDRSSLLDKDFLVDDQHSYIGFKIKYFGFSPVRGRFDEFNGTVFYDSSDIRSLAVDLIIRVSSINTGNERRDGDLITGSAWFNATEHPFMYFESQRAEPMSSGFLLHGNLTINGVTKVVSIPFDKPTRISRDWAANEQVDYSGLVTINRKDFGVNGEDFWDTVLEDGLTQLSDEVEIEIDVHTRRADYLARYDEMDSLNDRKVILDAISTHGIDSALTLLHSKENLSAGAMSTIAAILMERKEFDHAVSVLELALTSYPESTSLRNRLGICHLALKNQDLAKRHFEQAQALDSMDSKSRAYLRMMQN